MANVRLENVYKIYPNGVLAVKDFNLNIENEEFIVFVGPSGCGKSTTLRMIAGLEDISAGRVYIDNCLVNDLEPKDRDISMVFQNYALYPNMTVYDNMAYGLRCQKFDLDVEDVSEEKKKNKFAKVLLFIPHLIKNRFNCSKLKEIVIREKVMNAAEILGITDYLNRKPKELSGGQRQRVALGRAIVRNPKVFLLDEPLSNLDAKLRVQMRSEITKLHQKLGTTFIYVTHDQTEAMTMGTRIVVMKDGIVQQVDTPLNLYEHPDNTFVATFLGSPQMNLFSGVVMNKNGKTYFMSEDLEIEINEGTLLETGPLKDYHEIYLGVRPDDIKISDKGYTTKIELIEQLGNQTILYFLLPGKNDFSTITIQDPTRFFRVGEEITVSFNLDKLHLFDKESGESLKKANVTNVIKAKLTHNGSDLLINDLRLPNEFKKHFLDTKVTDINIHISSDKIQTKEDTKSLELKLEVMVNKIVKYSSYSVVFAELEDGTKVVFKTTDEIKEGKMNIYIPIYDAEYYSSDDRKICSRLLVNDSKVAYAEYRKTKSIGVLMPKDIETGLHIKLGVSNKLYRVLDREELNGSLILKLESTKAKKYEGDLVKEIVTISTDLVDLFEGQFVYIK